MKVCSDFDYSCVDVKDPFTCWMGHPPRIKDGMFFDTLPVADGYCPLVKQTNFEKDEMEIAVH